MLERDVVFNLIQLDLNPNNKGTFTITAWKTDVILRAEIKINSLIQSTNKPIKQKKIKKSYNKSSNSFAELAEKDDYRIVSNKFNRFTDNYNN